MTSWYTMNAQHFLQQLASGAQWGLDFRRDLISWQHRESQSFYYTIENKMYFIHAIQCNPCSGWSVWADRALCRQHGLIPVCQEASQVRNHEKPSKYNTIDFQTLLTECVTTCKNIEWHFSWLNCGSLTALRCQHLQLSVDGPAVSVASTGNSRLLWVCWLYFYFNFILLWLFGGHFRGTVKIPDAVAPFQVQILLFVVGHFFFRVSGEKGKCQKWFLFYCVQLQK